MWSEVVRFCFEEKFSCEGCRSSKAWSRLEEGRQPYTVASDDIEDRKPEPGDGEDTEAAGEASAGHRGRGHSRWLGRNARRNTPSVECGSRGAEESSHTHTQGHTALRPITEQRNGKGLLLPRSGLDATRCLSSRKVHEHRLTRRSLVSTLGITAEK